MSMSRPLLLSLCAATLLAGCSSLSLGGKSEAERQAEAVQYAPSNGVNSFLWRASLETMDFMPLDQVDPYGGVILTDWYADPAAPNERLKANIYILDTNLRADALKVAIFKQVQNGGMWQDASVDADTSRQVENAILSRARQLYIATVDAS